MNLFDQLNKYDQPQDEKPADPGFLCQLKSTRNGHRILLCNVEPAPQAAIDQAEKDGYPLFVPSEIELMRDIDQETVAEILLAKKVFPGCDVRQVIAEAAAA